MANTTSYPKRRKSNGKRSFKPDPKRLRPLKYKTALGLAFEKLAGEMGLGDLTAKTRTTATWEGTR